MDIANCFWIASWIQKQMDHKWWKDKSSSYLQTESNVGRKPPRDGKYWSNRRTGQQCGPNWRMLKNSYPVKMAEYAIQNMLDKELAFAWWVKYTVKKKARIVSNIKSKYWQYTYKYGIQIPKSVKEVRILDKENQNTLWWEVLMKEMKMSVQLLNSMKVRRRIWSDTHLLNVTLSRTLSLGRISNRRQGLWPEATWQTFCHQLFTHWWFQETW